MKSVKHSVCALSFLFALLFISLFSCQKQAHCPTFINTIKEQEAKQWLNQNYPNGLSYPGGMDTTIITARTSATFIQTQWSQTETYGGLLRVPTGNAYNRNIQKWIIRDLFFAKDSTGNIHSLVYEVRVDTSYIHKKMKEKNYNYSAIESYIDEKDFSGDILLYTLNNRFVQGRRYVDGACTYNVAFPKNTISNQGASKDEEPAEVFDWRWLDEVVVVGSYGGGGNIGGFIYVGMGPTYSYSNSGGYNDNSYYNNVPIVGGSGSGGESNEVLKTDGINGPKICKGSFTFLSQGANSITNNAKVWGISATYKTATGGMFNLIFGEEIFAPNNIKKGNWSFWSKLASQEQYAKLWRDGDIAEMTNGGGYNFSKYAQQEIAADATDYASYHASVAAKNGVDASTYKNLFAKYFKDWVDQYYPGLTMNILNSNIPGTTSAKLTDGDTRNCK